VTRYLLLKSTLLNALFFPCIPFNPIAHRERRRLLPWFPAFECRPAREAENQLTTEHAEYTEVNPITVGLTGKLFGILFLSGAVEQRQ